jgi:hypothetical protein
VTAADGTEVGGATVVIPAVRRPSMPVAGRGDPVSHGSGPRAPGHRPPGRLIGAEDAQRLASLPGLLADPLRARIL